jgi:hypothetical protein
MILTNGTSLVHGSEGDPRGTSRVSFALLGAARRGHGAGQWWGYFHGGDHIEVAAEGAADPASSPRIEVLDEDFHTLSRTCGTPGGERARFDVERNGVVYFRFASGAPGGPLSVEVTPRARASGSAVARGELTGRIAENQ